MLCISAFGIRCLYKYIENNELGNSLVLQKYCKMFEVDHIQHFSKIQIEICNNYVISYLMKILLIEDEPDLSLSISSYLNDNEILCESVNDCGTALEKIALYDYECILLDLMLPDGHGFEVLKALKQQRKAEGVIIISAIETLEKRIDGLALGADDFLVKPFHLAELLARIQSVVRRKNFDGNNVVAYNEIKVELQSKDVFVNNKKIELTKTELDLLLFLMGNKNRVLTKNVIAEHLSGDMADMLDNYDFIYSHIKNLKKKIKSAKGNDYIKTVYGLGYKWQ